MEGRAGALIVLGLLLGGVFAAAGAVATPVAPPAASAAVEEIQIFGDRAGPRLWKVSKGDHVLWLLGTLSHLPKHMSWRSSQVEMALAQSQQLLGSGPAVSTHLGPFGAIKLYFQWRRTQKDPDRTRLRDWLPAPLYARFEALKQRYDAHDSGIEELRPTFAALRLYQHAIDAAGLTDRDEVEQAVLKLARQQRVPIDRAALSVDDPAGALKEVSALPPSAEVACLDTTLTRLESDLPSMQQRAQAWAVGDVARLRALPYPDQREACIGALSSAPRIKALVLQAEQSWISELETNLSRYPVSFALRPIYDLLASDGLLARFRAEGYQIEGP